MKTYTFNWSDTITGRTTIEETSLLEAKRKFHNLDFADLHAASETSFDGEGFKINYVEEDGKEIDWDKEERELSRQYRELLQDKRDGEYTSIESWEAEERKILEKLKALGQ